MDRLGNLVVVMLNKELFANIFFLKNFESLLPRHYSSHKRDLREFRRQRPHNGAFLLLGFETEPVEAGQTSRKYLIFSEAKKAVLFARYLTHAYFFLSGLILSMAS